MHAGNYKPESYTGAYQYSISSVTKTTAEGAVLALRLLISLNDQHPQKALITHYLPKVVVLVRWSWILKLC